MIDTNEFEGHTPEPWQIEGVRVVTEDGNTIAICEKGWRGDEANTRLISAAPRLLRERDAALAKAERLDKAARLMMEQRDKARAQRDALLAMQHERDALLEACRFAASKFRDYVALHRAKDTNEGRDKANANEACAMRIERAIALCEKGQP